MKQLILMLLLMFGTSPYFFAMKEEEILEETVQDDSNDQSGDSDEYGDSDKEYNEDHPLYGDVETQVKNLREEEEKKRKLLEEQAREYPQENAVLTVVTIDNKQFHIPMSYVLQSNTLINFLESLKKEPSISQSNIKPDPIPLPNIKSEDFRLIYDYMGASDPEQKNMLEEWKKLSIDRHIALLQIANFLDMKPTIPDNEDDTVTNKLAEDVVQRLTVNDYKTYEKSLPLTLIKKKLVNKLSEHVTILTKEGQGIIAKFLNQKKFKDIINIMELLGIDSFLGSMLVDTERKLSETVCSQYFDQSSVVDGLALIPYFDANALTNERTTIKEAFQNILTSFAIKLSIGEFDENKNTCGPIVMHLATMVRDDLLKKITQFPKPLINLEDGETIQDAFEKFLEKYGLLGTLIDLKKRHGITMLLGSNKSFEDHLKYEFYKSHNQQTVWQDLYYNWYFPYQSVILPTVGIGTALGAGYLWQKYRKK